MENIKKNADGTAELLATDQSFLNKLKTEAATAARELLDAAALKAGDILVVTSGAKTAIALAERGVRVISTGGQMITRSFSYVGSHAEACVRGIRASTVFLSCRGLSEDGEVTDISIEEINLRRVMLERARTKILLCDSSKFGKQYLYSLGYKTDFDAVISEVDEDQLYNL